MHKRVFQPAVFGQWNHVRPSPFIRPIHPKTEIRPTAEAIQKILSAGWIGQLKINGHRAQIHIPPLGKDPELRQGDQAETLQAYNRQGQLHKKEIPEFLGSELKRIFASHLGWNVIDAEWMKNEDKLYVFDFLKKDGELLNRLSYGERWKQIPRFYISPCVKTLPLLTTLEQCLEALSLPDESIEGLVFKSPSPGFEDSSIIRCRR